MDSNSKARLIFFFKLRNIYLVNWFGTILTNPVRVHSARKLWKEKKVSYSRPDVCNWQRWLNNRSWVDIFRREMFKWIRIDSSDAVLVASHSRDVGRSKNLGGPHSNPRPFEGMVFCFQDCSDLL